MTQRTLLWLVGAQYLFSLATQSQNSIHYVRLHPSSISVTCTSPENLKERLQIEHTLQYSLLQWESSVKWDVNVKVHASAWTFSPNLFPGEMTSGSASCLAFDQLLQ